jgi:predicted amidohydrolase YtcJ
MSPDGPTLLIRDAEIGGQVGRGSLDVRVDADQVLEVGPRLARAADEPVIHAGGGALIPGLHDHHVHLRALIAAGSSVRLGRVGDPGAFDEAVQAACATLPADAWLRGVGWHESTAGIVDRDRLDALTGAHPARVQHRSGALWVLNSAGLELTGAATSDLSGVERDATGRPTGRLWRMDRWLRERTAPREGPARFAELLGALGREAARRGVTGVTDATPDRDQADVDAFAAISAARVLPQRLLLMAPAGLQPPENPRVRLGPHKIVLDDDTLPTVDTLADVMRESHRRSVPVAVHCVTAEQLIVTVAALEAAGAHPGDRIEHGAVVPPGYAARIAALHVAVITQPAFLAERGDEYLREVEPAEQAWLYPCGSLLRAGAGVAFGTDAPFGPSDPWFALAAAVHRRTVTGTVIGEDERVRPAVALDLLLRDPEDLYRTRRVAPGEPGDLCLLRAPLAAVLAAPSPTWVQGVAIAGRYLPAGS